MFRIVRRRRRFATLPCRKDARDDTIVRRWSGKKEIEGRKTEQKDEILTSIACRPFFILLERSAVRPQLRWMFHVAVLLKNGMLVAEAEDYWGVQRS